MQDEVAVNSEECFECLDLMCFLLNCHSFLLKCLFCGPNQRHGNGSLLVLVDGCCEDVTVQRGRYEGRVRERGKRGHEPVETTVMLMPLDLIYYISVQSKMTVSFHIKM